MLLTLELALIYVSMIFTAIYVGKVFSDSKLMLYGIGFCIMGAIFAVFSYFFDAPLVGLLYGVKLQTGSPELGVLTGILFIGIGLVCLLIYWIILKIKQ